MKKIKGFTLTELLLVIGFIALAGISVYVIYNKVKTSQLAYTEAKNISTLKAGIKNLNGGSVSYFGMSNYVANNARITPDNMRKMPPVIYDGLINNNFGGTIVVGATSLNTPFLIFNGLIIVDNKVPNEICPKLIMGLEKDFDKITINGNIVKDYGTNNLNVPLMASFCNVGNSVNIAFSSLEYCIII